MKKTLKALEKKGVKVVELSTPAGGKKQFDGLYMGKKDLLDAKGNKIGTYEVIGIHRDTFKRPASLSKILLHEVGHWHTFANAKNSKDFAKSATLAGEGSELNLPHSLEAYQKFAAGDESRQYVKQGMKELRGVAEWDIQTNFKTERELPLDQVFGSDYKNRIFQAQGSLKDSAGFSKFEAKTYDALSKQILEKPLSPTSIIDHLDGEGILRIPVKNGSDHWEKSVMLDADAHTGAPSTPSEIEALKVEKTDLVAKERDRLIKEMEFTDADLKDPEMAAYLDRKSLEGANGLLAEKHPWMKNFNEKLSQDFKNRADRYAKSNSEVLDALEKLGNLERKSKITKQEYTELISSLSKGSSSLRSDGQSGTNPNAGSKGRGKSSARGAIP